MPHHGMEGEGVLLIQPFRVHSEGMKWCVSMDHPWDPTNFVVVYRSGVKEDCVPVCEALNRLFEEHLRVRVREK